MSAVAEKRVLVLQGGGALGAYQAGAYAALAEAGLEPDWVAGISIGAINAALIAGNTPPNRVGRLRQFWEKVSSGLQGQALFPGGHGRSLFNEASSWLATLYGIPGFFSPRFPPPALALPGSDGAVSFYDTAPLRATLDELVDYKVLNNNEHIRASFGAVNIRSGNFRYFDSRHEPLGSSHVLASGALPPGFAPVEINGESYWDGGLVSNTPLQYVVDEAENGTPLCIFQVDLFSARGELPKTIYEAAEREKEIRYSSRTRMNTSVMRDMQRLRKAAKRLMAKLPDALAEDPDARFLAEAGRGPGITVMHLINRGNAFDNHSKDNEFSRLSMEEHWAAGHADVITSLNHPDWIARHIPKHGMKVFDLTRKPQQTGTPP